MKKSIILASLLCASAVLAEQSSYVAHVQGSSKELELPKGEFYKSRRISGIQNKAILPNKELVIAKNDKKLEGKLSNDLSKQNKPFTTAAANSAANAVVKEQKELIQALKTCNDKCESVKVGDKNIPYAQAKKEHARILARKTCKEKHCIIGDSLSDRKAWLGIAVKSSLDASAYFYGEGLDHAGIKAFEILSAKRQELTMKWGKYEILSSEISAQDLKGKEKAYTVELTVKDASKGIHKIVVRATLETIRYKKLGVVDMRIKDLLSVEIKGE